MQRLFFVLCLWAISSVHSQLISQSQYELETPEPVFNSNPTSFEEISDLTANGNYYRDLHKDLEIQEYPQPTLGPLTTVKKAPLVANKKKSMKLKALGLSLVAITLAAAFAMYGKGMHKKIDTEALKNIIAGSTKILKTKLDNLKTSVGKQIAKRNATPDNQTNQNNQTQQTNQTNQKAQLNNKLDDIENTYSVNHAEQSVGETIISHVNNPVFQETEDEEINLREFFDSVINANAEEASAQYEKEEIQTDGASAAGDSSISPKVKKSIQFDPVVTEYESLYENDTPEEAGALNEDREDYYEYYYVPEVDYPLDDEDEYVADLETYDGYIEVDGFDEALENEYNQFMASLDEDTDLSSMEEGIPLVELKNPYQDVYLPNDVYTETVELKDMTPARARIASSDTDDEEYHTAEDELLEVVVQKSNAEVEKPKNEPEKQMLRDINGIKGYEEHLKANYYEDSDTEVESENESSDEGEYILDSSDAEPELSQILGAEGLRKRNARSESPDFFTFEPVKRQKLYGKADSDSSEEEEGAASLPTIPRINLPYPKPTVYLNGFSIYDKNAMYGFNPYARYSQSSDEEYYDDHYMGFSAPYIADGFHSPSRSNIFFGTDEHDLY